MNTVMNIFKARCRFYDCIRSHLLRSMSSSNDSRLILGIESSCDDTGCAIVDTDGRILGQCIISQQEEVRRLGGVIPTVARDLHQQNISNTVEQALKNASVSVQDLDAIAVTTKPGLTMSLLVGLNYAKSLSKQYKKTFIPIHHMEAHALVGRLVCTQDLSFPYLTFLISGGHCLLAVVHSIRKFTLLGQSWDDAPGEILDKAARRLKIFNVPQYSGLSGGAAIEQAAKSGNELAFKFTEPLLHYPNCDFSFSGTKSHILRLITYEEQKYNVVGDDVLPNLADLCASFQYSIAKHLCRRLQRAMEYVDQRNLLPKENLKLVVSGGVACNSYLSRAFQIVCQELGYSLVVPAPLYCTDNGVMIAWNGVEKFRENVDLLSYHQLDAIIAEPDCPLGEDLRDDVQKAAIKCKWIKLHPLLHENVFIEKQEVKVEKNE